MEVIHDKDAVLWSCGRTTIRSFLVPTDGMGRRGVAGRGEQSTAGVVSGGTGFKFRCLQFRLFGQAAILSFLTINLKK